MDLLIDNRKILPHPWYNYPVLQKGFEVISLCKSSKWYKQAVIKIGKQDGVWVLGYDINGGGCNPGRKWGEFSSRENAIRYFVSKFLPEMEESKKNKSDEYSYSPAELNEIIANMKKLIDT